MHSSIQPSLRKPPLNLFFHIYTANFIILITSLFQHLASHSLFLQPMLKTAASIFIALTFSFCAIAQNEAIVQEGELGISFGGAHYFGDINNRSAIDKPSPAVGVYFKKQFGQYIAVRVSGHYAKVGYADEYSNVEFQQRRNLNFSSQIWEMAVQGDFNFFNFIPGDPYYKFTPYVTLGVGSMNYDPYTFLEGKKYFLRKLGTEGQGSALFPERKAYRNQAFCFPLGMGIKYNLGKNINLSFEVTYRFTSTDYLDDVSSSYAGITAFPPLGNGNPSPAFLLQDRSYETGSRIGEIGRQRGFSEQKDQYVIAEIGISISFSSYKCANPK